MAHKVLSEIKKICYLFEEHKVLKAYIFGSVLTNKYSSESDIDFLVKFKDGINPLEKGELWWSLHDKLRQHLNREIDIVTENSLKNPYFIKELEKTKQLIYG